MSGACCALLGEFIGAETNLLIAAFLPLSTGRMVTIEEDEMESAPDETRRSSS